MTKYYLEDFAPPGRPPKLIRHRDDALIERYNFSSRHWVEDSEMLQIYTGDISVDTITEEEAKEVIKRYA